MILLTNVTAKWEHCVVIHSSNYVKTGALRRSLGLIAPLKHSSSPEGWHPGILSETVKRLTDERCFLRARARGRSWSKPAKLSQDCPDGEVCAIHWHHVVFRVYSIPWRSKIWISWFCSWGTRSWTVCDLRTAKARLWVWESQNVLPLYWIEESTGSYESEFWIKCDWMGIMRSDTYKYR